MGKIKTKLLDINNNVISEGDTIKKVRNTDIGTFKGGIVMWDNDENCFKCGDVILYSDYMDDFEIIKTKNPLGQ